MKRRWWLWLLLALACLVIVFGVSELTGISIGSIFGWGALGTLGVIAVIILTMFVAFFAFFIAWLLTLLLENFISNEEKLSITLGILGFCAILVGYITAREFEWSLFIVMVGFFTGCLAGVKYQRFLVGSDKE